jgi:paraquat-inducible protein A
VTARGADLGLVGCSVCALVMRRDGDGDLGCSRCGEAVHPRTRDHLGHVWALVIAAAVLYLPANLMTIMHTEQFPTRRDDTIFSGVAYLWEHGSWDLAVIVFVASIVVPLVKLCALVILLVTTRRRSIWRPRARTKLYRVLETIGHWSMLDVFVVVLLTSIVQLGAFARVEPGPAVIPFAGVVVLTMLASAAFDPRSIWDGPR